ncbi:MAG: RNA chaperone Hfq [Blastocatellia bacterium]
MPAKKKTEDTSETTAIKTPRKRATKKAIEAEAESETLTNNNSVAASEVIEAVEIKEVNEVTNDKLVEVTNMPASANLETTPLANLDTVEATTDNNQTSATDSVNEDLEGSEKKKKKKGKNNDGRMGKQDIDVQKEFYDRIINEELEVTIQLGKLKIEGVIIYEDQYSILIKSKFGEQMLYKQGISFISFKKPFRRPFIRRDRPFFNNRENTDNQPINDNDNDNDKVRQDSSNNQPTFDKAQTQKPTINKPETTQQPIQQTTQQSSEQPMRRPNEPKPLGRYQNQPPKNQPPKNQPSKNQPPKNQPQKDAREVKVYKIVCAPPVKPKK